MSLLKLEISDKFCLEKDLSNRANLEIIQDFNMEKLCDYKDAALFVVAELTLCQSLVRNIFRKHLILIHNFMCSNKKVIIIRYPHILFWWWYYLRNQYYYIKECFMSSISGLWDQWHYEKIFSTLQYYTMSHELNQKPYI